MRNNKLEDEIKPFLSRLLLVMVVITVSGTLTEAMSKGISLGHLRDGNEYNLSKD